MIFRKVWLVVEVLIETVPFSLFSVTGWTLFAAASVSAVILAVFSASVPKREKSFVFGCWPALSLVLFVVSASVVGVVHGANTERHALNSSDYTYYGAYDATVERVTLTDYTVRTDYGAVLTIPYSMGWVDGHVDKGDRVALDVSRMSTNENQSIIVRGGDDMDVMFLMDEACVSRFDSRGARVPRGVECHRAFGDTEYKGSVLLGGGGTYYVLTGGSRL